MTVGEVKNGVSEMEQGCSRNVVLAGYWFIVHSIFFSRFFLGVILYLQTRFAPFLILKRWPREGPACDIVMRCHPHTDSTPTRPVTTQVPA